METEPSIYDIAKNIESLETTVSKSETVQEMKLMNNPVIAIVVDKVILSLEKKKKINPVIYFLIAPYTLFIRIITTIDIIYFAIAMYIYSLFLQADVAANVARIIARPERAKHIAHIKGFKILTIILELITIIYLLIKFL